MAVRHIILVLRSRVLVIYEDPTNLYWDEKIIVGITIIFCALIMRDWDLVSRLLPTLVKFRAAMFAFFALHP